MEEAEKLFYQDMREKRVSASGARHKKGKQGRVGRMITPADLSGPEYRRPGEPLTYNLAEFVGVLSQSPSLKEALLARLDEEYRNYRLAIERTVEAVSQLVGAALRDLTGEVSVLRNRVQDLEEAVRKFNGQEQAGNGPERREPRMARRRIRWGTTPDEIKATSFQVLEDLEKTGERITVGLIRSRAPSLMRWLYGEKAVFTGLKGLLEEYERRTARAVGS